MQEIPDDILIKASQGDIDSFEVVYRAMSGFVYNVAVRITNNREDAEEVTQEVFLILHRRLKEFRFESSVKTWVYRITVNYAIDFIRKTSPHRNKTIEFDNSIAASKESDTHQEIEKEYSNQMIDQLLGMLNADQRACVVLRNIEGLSYEQISKTLKININTVRSRLKRAREKILETGRKVIDAQL